MYVHLRVTPDLADAFAAAGVTSAAPGSPTVISTPSGFDDWPSTLAALEELFEAAKAAATEGSSVVFMVSSDALLGRTGALDAMAAVGVVSASRTMALEVRKQGATVNCVATNQQTPDAEATRWALHLLESGPDGPSGELVQLGGVQIGKALS
jgi:NAD(P)-dependent dehydrogenase (short-subunit alcohol dehydrogenase family)